MTKWIVDPDHSVAAFSIRHMMISTVRGQCNSVHGAIHLDSDDLTRSSVEVTIDVKSLTTGIKKRDEHLHSPDFFDAENHPTIIFKSTRIEPTAVNSCKVTGDLTIRSITRPVTLNVDFVGPIKSPYGETSMGFSARTEVNREDFNVLWNEPVEKGGVMVGKFARLFLEVEADLAE